MKKVMLTTAAILTLSTTAFAADATKEEKCVVSKAGEPEVSVMVPAGECEKVQKGDFSGVSEEVKAKVEGAAH
jgi:hypothetical protein